MKKITWIVLLTLLTGVTSCVAVKPYQKAKLNDLDMSLSIPEVGKLNSLFQSYREGSSGASSGKTGGGCGCN